VDSISSISSISSSQSTSYTQGSARSVGLKRLMDASAEYLGLSANDLRTQLQAGKSLADIAKAEGKSVDGLKQALQAVLSSDQSGGTDSSALLDKILNGHPGKPPAQDGKGFEDVLKASAEYLGISTDDLQTQLQAGKSFADIAKAEGKSVDGLKQALQAALPAPPTQSSDGASATSSVQGVDSSSFLDQIINGHPGKHHHGAVQSTTSTDDTLTSSSVNLLV
jgi:lambda repressor-like predicted transcriptional regulator